MAQILEAELEEYLFDNYKEIFSYKLEDEVIYPTNIFRQFRLGTYGVIDLLVLFKNKILIVELKQNEIDFNAIGQICRYKTGFSRLFTNSFCCIEYLLIGKSMQDGDACFIMNELTDDMGFWEYQLDFKKGIVFNKDEFRWHNIEENFNVMELPKQVKALHDDFIYPDANVLNSKAKKNVKTKNG